MDENGKSNFSTEADDKPFKIQEFINEKGEKLNKNLRLSDGGPKNLKARSEVMNLDQKLQTNKMIVQAYKLAIYFLAKKTETKGL